MAKPKPKATAVVVSISRFMAGMTVAKVARDLGMNTRSVTALKKGTEKGEWVTLVNLSRYFNVSVEDLLGAKEDEN